MAGAIHQVFTVTADSVTLRGLEIREVGASATDDRAGIKVVEAKGCVIEDDVLIDTFFGIYLSKASGCVVRHNRLRASGKTEVLSGNAIHSWSSDHLLIEDNDIAGHRDGIYFEFTTAARVRRNRSRSNLRYGLHFMFSNDCEYSGNVFEGNGAGVAVMYSKNISMREQSVQAQLGARRFRIAAQGNQRQPNRAEQLYREQRRPERRRNQSPHRGRERFRAQRVGGTGDGRRGRDRFPGQSVFGKRVRRGDNSVNSATRFSGNYWDRYSGYDLDRDGTGDVPFAPVRRSDW